MGAFGNGITLYTFRGSSNMGSDHISFISEFDDYVNVRIVTNALVDMSKFTYINILGRNTYGSYVESHTFTSKPNSYASFNKTAYDSTKNKILFGIMKTECTITKPTNSNSGLYYLGISIMFNGGSGDPDKITKIWVS